MRIAFVSDAIYPYNKGGKEKRLFELSTRLAKMGHEVHIYTMHWWDTSETERSENGVTLHAICRFHNMYHGNRRSIKEAILFSLACLKLTAVKFDVIDVDHMPFFPIYACWLVCKLRGEKLYGTWHEALSTKDWIEYMGKTGRIASVVESISVRLPHHIISSSPRTKKLLYDLHAHTKEVSVITPGLDAKMLKKVQPTKAKCDVLYVGRFVKDKNIDKLIAAIDIVSKTYPNISCTIIGHGTEKHNLQRQITKLGLNNNVTLLEPLNKDEDVYAYMKTAKVFCLPSVREGFGIVAIEALACGTPVITINVPANASRELIKNNKNGSIVSLEPKAIADAIDKWVSRPKAINFSKEATKYDWDELALRQVGVYAV